MNEIICSLEKEGFIAHYYPGTKETNKAIIFVGGASCDEKTCIGYLRREGYNVLVLGFYLWKGLSKNLAGIPVEYVEKAVNWLKCTKGIEKIAMTGASTGAGYTLVCASLIPDITCVIPVVPFDYVMEGTSSSNKRLHCSVYTYSGKDIPYTETPMSDVAVPRMLKVLEEYNYPHRVESHIYDKGSHALVDGLNEMSGMTRFLLKTMIPAEKKYPKECEEARQDSFARIIKFIEMW